MGNKMLIDAAHPEETRVVVLRGNRIEEFDFEAANKKQLRGNIYLAKVTRVEPSLQAAFIEYGGNRHGFLAFSEIHPDYYQIPVADRQQLLEDEARSAEEDEEEPRSGGAQGGNGHRRSRRHRRGGGSAEKRSSPADEAVTSDEEPGPGAEAAADPIDEHELHAAPDGAGDAPVAEAPDADDLHGDDPAVEAGPQADGEPDMVSAEVEAAEDHEPSLLEVAPEASHDEPEGEPDAAGHEGSEAHEDDVVEQLGGDALEDVPHRVSRPRRNYKIQEVIKRRQVLLVQVAKEERGNKGAALTTYLSLAGRYSVLMPNTARGGGISRKIVDPEDRKRLKAIAQELEVPEGMGIILRTAGAARGMPEVKRDFEYLLRMWETVRETTLQSTAPTLVYEEGSLIKRSIRDLFTKDVDEVVVAGEDAYREAKDFMRLLMPTHVRNVIAWRDPQPIFAKAGAEAQLDAMFSNQVVLKSGGYLVINQTEALVAIDVNSGRSTREHNIEDTAVRTNLEAADEVARQLRLRDLAGLIVVDFIDMEEGRNDRAVERRLKDALKNDRARIQIGRISHFGLLEMSRQRMRTGVLEGSTVMCPHCAGSGSVRSVSSMALHVLRLLEDTLIRSATHNLIGRTRSEVAIYILNQKRANLLDLESRFGVSITILADPVMTGMVYHAIDRGGEATPPQRLAFRPGPADAAMPEDEVEEDVVEVVGDDLEEISEGDEAAASSEDGSRAGAPLGEGGRRRRRRRRRRGGREDQEPRGSSGLTAEPQGEADGAVLAGEGEVPETEALTDIESGFIDPADAPQPAEPAESTTLETSAPDDIAAVAPAESPEAAAPAEGEEAVPEAPRRRRSPRRNVRAGEPAAEPEVAPVEADVAAAETAPPARRSRRPRRATAETVAPTDEAASVSAPPPESPPAEPELPLAAAAPVAVAPDAPAPAEPAPEPEDPDRPKRSGWWQRAKATFSAGS